MSVMVLNHILLNLLLLWQNSLPTCQYIQRLQVNYLHFRQDTSWVIMTVASTCFKWVDLLETQFDKSWIELDTMLLQLEEDEDFAFLYTKSRRHVSSLGKLWVERHPYWTLGSQIIFWSLELRVLHQISFKYS